VTVSEGLDALRSAIRAVLDERRLSRQLVALETPRQVDDFAPELVGESPNFQEVRARLKRASQSEATVMITGETGTGKEMAARAIHRSGARCGGPFVPVGCSAISATLVESEFFGHTKGAFTHAASDHTGLLVRADGGTLFLDEMSDLRLDLQAKLLRTLQERKVRPLGSRHEVPFNARIIVASRRDLGHEVSQGRFREDLYFRLKVIEARLPPLRDRQSDILLLAQHFIRSASRPERPILGMTATAARVLLTHEWLGNVRELEHAMIASVAVARYDRVSEEDLPEYTRRTSQQGEEETPPLPLREVEEQHIRHVLDAVGGNRSLASRILGLDRKTLARRLNALSRPVPVHIPASTPRAQLDSTPG
jgi:DNA-binding NtrC family response regulator